MIMAKFDPAVIFRLSKKSCSAGATLGLRGNDSSKFQINIVLIEIAISINFATYFCSVT